MKEMPGYVFRLELLKSVDLSRNKVGVVAEEIGQARALVEINLSENCLEYCPNLDKIRTL